MKTIFTLLIFFATLVVRSQSYEIVTKDTINFTDVNNKRQGQWVIFGKVKKGCFQPDQVAEKGMYNDNKRVGTWIEYHCNGNLKSNVSYSNGRPFGSCSFYYRDGTLWEEGTWKNNRWIGKYTYMNEVGDRTEIVFDEKGDEVSKKVIPAKKK